MGLVDVAAQAAAWLASMGATKYKIEEGIADYGRAITDIKARIKETQAERDRRIAITKTEGVLGLKETAAQAGYEARTAMTQAEMIASSQEHRLGASGVRMHGSPLMAAQQQVDLAFAAADRTIEQGQAAVKMGGLKLGSALANIGAESSLLTAEYQRNQAELAFKKGELEANKAKMLLWVGLGGLPGLASSFYDTSKNWSSSGNGFFSKGLDLDWGS